MDKILDRLNEQQREAVTHEGGPALVLAGAGSGKTRVLTTRAAWLLAQKKVSPESLMLVTFTNKAANEINKRIFELTQARLPLSGTFHSLCAKFLRRDGHLAGLDASYTIYDADDQLALVKQIYKKHGFNTKEHNPRAVKGAISAAKNELLSASDYETMAVGNFQEFVAQVYHLYQRALHQSNAVDFDDLLFKMVKLLQSNKQVLGHYQEMIEHVLVDEYQDTNKAQYQLTKLLAKPQNNVFVVGDFAQSIYSWRGADYRNMMNLKNDFDGLKEYRLERNYRSTQTILDAATQVISKTSSHPVLDLWTEQTLQEKIVCFETGSDLEEARKVLEEVTTTLRDYNYNDIAILYRTNAQSRSFEEACVRLGIPYRLIGGFKFYERKEIKDVLAYLHLFLNPSDAVFKERATKIGKRRLASFETWRDKYLKEITDTSQANPHEVLKHILETTKYTDKYDKDVEEDASRLENIQELLNVAGQFDSIANFLENVALVQDDYMADLAPEDDQQALTLMSLHSAKGLEYPVIFVAGMEDGVLPHSRSLFDKSQLEEERRLCYVGITRAKERLYFTFARKRWQHGKSSYGVRSRFLEDIPNELIDYLSSVPESNSWQSNGNGFSQKSKSSFTPKRRVVVDDDTLDGLLSGEIDIDKFLDN